MTKKVVTTSKNIKIKIWFTENKEAFINKITFYASRILKPFEKDIQLFNLLFIKN